MYPKIEIKLNNILENVRKTQDLFKERGVKLSVVVKVLRRKQRNSRSYSKARCYKYM